MRRLTQRVTLIAVGVLCGCLLGVGGVTAGLLHLRALRSLDQSLLAAAYAEAHPWQEQRFANDYVRSPVQVRPWSKDDPRVPAALYEEAVKGEMPLWRTFGGRRVLLLVVEPVDKESDREERHEHLVVVAEAAAVTLADAVLPFASVYLLVSALAAAVAALAVHWGMSLALAPLSAAAVALQRVQGLGSGARLELAAVEEVDELIGSTNALLDRLDRAFDAQTNFTASAAHELRTPVTVMKGELQLALRRERTEEDYRDTLRRTLRQVEQLAELVEGLMALTRVEAGQADRGRALEHVSMVLLRAVEQERSRLEAAGCTVEQDLGCDPEVSVHLGLLTTAVANLLRNVAVHAPGATVKVHAETSDGVVRVVVDDDGPGVAESDREAALQRFVQGGGQGLGLGLALVREVARRHGGDLVLDASPSGGLRAVLSVASADGVG
jgi:signal transduction histidine kinase